MNSRALRPSSLLVAVLLFAAPVALSAQKPLNGFAPDRLARIDKFLQAAVDSNRIAGATALVLRDGKPVYEKSVGWADKESARKMTNDVIFRIASQSKAITSVAILMLVEEGKIAITDPVRRFIPAYATTTVALPADTGRNPVRARGRLRSDLLTHTAGISYGTDARVAQRYAAVGLGPNAGWGWYTADKTEPICASMENSRRFRSSRSPARNSSTVTTPIFSVVWWSARRACRSTNSSRRASPARSA
jgi:CubicO group peptidase (beta-lactamase class C family)